MSDATMKLIATAVYLILIAAVITLVMYAYISKGFEWAWGYELLLATGVGIVLTVLLGGLGTYLGHYPHKISL